MGSRIERERSPAARHRVQISHARYSANSARVMSFSRERVDAVVGVS
jgi:hypothetical protein